MTRRLELHDQAQLWADGAMQYLFTHTHRPCKGQLMKRLKVSRLHAPSAAAPVEGVFHVHESSNSKGQT